MEVAVLLADVLTELQVLAPGETMSPGDEAFVLGKLNRVLDNWNAERAAVYAQAFNTYVLTPSLTPHTIGPTGTFVVTSRPVSVDGAGLVLTTSTPNVRIPITLRDEQWWQAQSVKGLTSSIPTDLYYEPDFPNGKLFFWPVPSSAYSVELNTRLLLTSVLVSDTITLPPGYQDALTWTTAEESLAGFAVPADMGTQIMLRASQARARIFNNNDIPRRLRTRDAGMPGPTRGSGFNYLSRQFTE